MDEYGDKWPVVDVEIGSWGTVMREVGRSATIVERIAEKEVIYILKQAGRKSGRASQVCKSGWLKRWA